MMAFRKPHQTADLNCIHTDTISGNTEIKPKGLNIIWGNDLRYWKITNENAELIQVSWLEVSGKVNVVKGNSYSVTFDVEVKKNGFGWENTEVLVMAKIGKRGQYRFEAVRLANDGITKTIPDKPLQIKVDPDEKDPDLHFGLYEVWSGKWKGGLIIKKAHVDVDK